MRSGTPFLLVILLFCYFLVLPGEMDTEAQREDAKVIVTKGLGVSVDKWIDANIEQCKKKQ